MITLDEINVNGKTVFVRIDLNCPVDKVTLKVQDSPRLEGHAKTVKEIANKGAKVVLLAHQGRKGDWDFLPLQQHAELFEKHVGKPVKFVPDVCGVAAKVAITNTKSGEIILLDNVRNLDDETTFKTVEECKNATIVKELGQFCDVFVLDAFSVAHRVQASVVGFYQKTFVAGREMQHELEALDKVSKPKRPVVFVLGGSKPEDSVGIMKEFLQKGKMDACLTCGVLGIVMMKAQTGKDLGEATEKFLKDSGAAEFLPAAKELLEKYKGKIMVPSDVAFLAGDARQECSSESTPCAGAIMDIGKRTMQEYSNSIASASTIIINGPAGVYEQDAFGAGTQAILKAIEQSRGFSLVGGGHTISAIEKYRIDKSKIGHISLAGKALIAYLSGETLAGVKLVKDARMDGIIIA